MEVTFTVNHINLISKILNSDSLFVNSDHNKEFNQAIVQIKNSAWEANKKIYQVASGRMEILKYSIINDVPLEKSAIELNNLYEFVKQHDEYKCIYEQTNKSIEKIRQEWNSNYKVTSEYINDLDIKLTGSYSVFVTHENFLDGRYLGNNCISWSYKSIWPNYNTVYIWHELLHSYFEQSDITHALIELITDDHMRKILNGTEYPPFVGHTELEKIKYKLLPEWRDYLEKSNKNLNKLISLITSNT